jgi:hypothetical protein
MFNITYKKFLLAFATTCVFFYNFCVEYKEPLKSGDKVIVTKHNGKVNLEEGLMSGEIVGFDVRTGKFEILLPNGRHHFAFPDCVARVVPTTTNEKKKGGDSGKNKSTITTALDASSLEEGGIRKPTNKGNMTSPPLTMNIIKLQPVFVEAPPSSSKTSGDSSSNLPRPITSVTERELRTINKKEGPTISSSSSSSSSKQRLVKLQTILNSENPKANYAASLGIAFTTDKEPTSHVNKNNKNNNTKKIIVAAPQQAAALDKRSESLERPAPEREPRPVVAAMPPSSSSSSSSSKKTVAVPSASIKKSSSSITNEDNNNNKNNNNSMMKVKTTKASAATTTDQQNLSTAAQIIRSRIQSERNATRTVVL